MISAKILVRSRHPDCSDTVLTTFELEFPTFILPEVLTHRDRARNASSHRAMPTQKAAASAVARPLRWGSNRAGMQPGEDLPEDKAALCEALWEEAARAAVFYANELAKAGLHKQWTNRLLAPFTVTRMVMSSTNWSNFLDLRDSPYAQDEIRLLAQKIRHELDNTSPNVIDRDSWHLPYVDIEDLQEIREYLKIHTSPLLGLKRWERARQRSKALPHPDSTTALALAVSAARCARVSYKSFGTDKRSSIEEDVELFVKLVQAEPPHASPLEHQALPDQEDDCEVGCSLCRFRHPHLSGPFRGFLQFRKLLGDDYRIG